MNGHPRVAVYSRRKVEQKVWQASQYEFEDVICEIDDATLVMTHPARGGAGAELLRRGLNRVGRPLHRDRRAVMSAGHDEVDAELFFAVFAAPHEIGALPFLRSQLSRSARRVAFIVEMYTTDLPSSADYIRQLRGFDHIFVFTRDVIPAIHELTGVPTSFLPTGIDSLLFAPSLPFPARSIDVMSYGRRLPDTHAALRAAQIEGKLHYSYDTVRGAFAVSDSRDHRAALASRLQRSSFAVIYKNNDEPSRVVRTGGEETLTNRYYEATSAGAIVLGSSPDLADFDTEFPWPDAVIPIAAPAPDIANVIASLSRDQARLDAARLAGIRAGLERHDWSYRWDVVLDAVGMRHHERGATRQGNLGARLAALSATYPG
jgi:hypothetical protein